MGVGKEEKGVDAGVVKPVWPYPDPKLYAHGSRKWAKKIHGKTVYFGSWDNPRAALEEYRKFVGEDGEAKSAEPGLTVEEGVNLFLTRSKKRVASGELSQLSYADYYSTGRKIMEHLGRKTLIETLSPTEFAEFRDFRARTCNVITTGNECQRTRTIFDWLADSQLIHPVEYGPDFKRPGNRVVKRHKRERGAKLFDPRTLNLVLDECGVHLRAMALLGINCAFGPTDCARLELRFVRLALDAGDIISYARTKTEEDRFAWIWPETREALEQSIKRRNDPVEDSAKLLFVYHDGGSWQRSANPITKHFGQAVGRTGRKQETFYWLRHSFETIAGQTGDQVAVNTVMGHADSSMAATYRHGVDDERIKRVCLSVRSWLFGTAPQRYSPIPGTAPQ